jgi:hypothetical protein
LFEIQTAVRETLDVRAPAPPMDAIRSRAQQMAARSAARFRMTALAALVLSLAGLGFAVAEREAPAGPPLPVASSTPSPTVT